MGTFSEKLIVMVCCAVAVILAFATLSTLVAPLIRHLLFASPLCSTHVKAQVQEAYIVGSFRSGRASGSGVGTGGPTYRDLRFFLVAQYQFGGKTYTTRTYALYNQDVSLPGSPGGG